MKSLSSPPSQTSFWRQTLISTTTLFACKLVPLKKKDNSISRKPVYTSWTTDSELQYSCLTIYWKSVQHCHKRVWHKVKVTMQQWQCTVYYLCTTIDTSTIKHWNCKGRCNSNTKLIVTQVWWKSSAVRFLKNVLKMVGLPYLKAKQGMKLWVLLRTC